MTERKLVGKVEGAPVDKLLAKRGMPVFTTVKVSLIRPSPANPRKTVDGPTFDELVASIERQGILEPIIVRAVSPAPASGKKTKVPAEFRDTAWEVVAGHRRLAAAKKIGLEFIPCVVANLNDAEAREVGLIENLQRVDLSELEEAQGFDAYLRKVPGNFTDEAFAELAEKVGKPTRYIRARVSILRLPEAILKAWANGKVSFALLLQFLRIPKDQVEAKVKEVLRASWMTAERLREELDRESISFSKAVFLDGTAKDGACNSCPSNTIVQRDLFGLGLNEAKCCRPVCFIDKQINALRTDWKDKPWAKKYGTNGPAFLETYDRNYRGAIFADRVPKKCADCKDFVTVLSPTLEVRAERVCIGKAGCLAGAMKETSKKKGSAPARKPGEVRVPWHGPYLRDAFLYARLPGVLAEAPAWKKDGPGTEVERTVLFGLARNARAVEPAVAKALGLGQGYLKDVALYQAIIAAPKNKFAEAVRAAAEALVLEEEPKQGAWSGGFGRECRTVAGELFGIRLDLDYAVDEAFLEKKTKAEGIEFVRKFKFDKEKALIAYLAKTFDRKPDELEKMKKSEVSKAILKSGLELRGKVPAEILGKAKK